MGLLKSLSRPYVTFLFRSCVRPKKALLDGASGVFDAGKATPEQADGPKVSELYEKIGQLTVERDFLRRRPAP
jgi:hypothetical protein